MMPTIMHKVERMNDSIRQTAEVIQVGVQQMDDLKVELDEGLKRLEKAIEAFRTPPKEITFTW